MDPNAVLNKLIRLAKLDTTVFDEVRDDANELIPAMIVAAVSALLSWARVFSDHFDSKPTDVPWTVPMGTGRFHRP